MMWLNDAEGAEFSLYSNNPVKIHISNSSIVDQIISNQVIVRVTGQIGGIDPRTSELLHSLRDNRLPIDANTENWSNVGIDENRKFINPTQIPLSCLPKYAKDFFDDCDMLCSDAIQSTIGTIRWRLGIPGPIYSKIKERLEWSLDGENWLMRPIDLKAPLGRELMKWGLLNLARFDEVEQSEIQSMLSQFNIEPGHHEILREASSQAPGNYRSALIMTIAAIESGIKSLISSVSIESGWLLDNIQSPPIDKLIREYMPTLPLSNLMDGSVKIPGKKDMKLLVELRDTRNKVIHGKRIDLNKIDFEAAFELAENLLYLFDYYAGIDWALNRVNTDFLGRLEIPKSSG